MSAKILYGYFANFYMRGSPNAAVLPLPVSALAMTLYPLRIEGMASFWIGVGVIYWIFSQVRSNKEDNPSLLKDIYKMIIPHSL